MEKDKEQEIKQECPECTQRCDGATLSECEECGQVHCKNCE